MSPSSLARCRTLVGFLFFLLLVRGAAAQGPEWANGVPWPGPRNSVAMACDEARGRLVAFGGIGTTFLQETWEFDGVAWHQRFPATSPPATFSGSMAYDPERRTTILVAGAWLGGAGTWEWDGDDWTFITSSPPLNASSSPRLAYHTGSGQGMLLLGRFVTGFFTWEPATYRLAGNSWVLVHQNSPADGELVAVPSFGTVSHSGHVWDGVNWQTFSQSWPSGLTRSGSYWDPRRAQIIAYAIDAVGSYTVAGTFTGPGQLSWTATSNFVQTSAAFAPPLVSASLSSVCYDSARGRGVFAFGRAGQSSIDHVYELSSTSLIGPWTRRLPMTTTPGGRTYSDQSHDPALGRTVLFGGAVPAASGVLGDTWSFDGRQWTNHGTNLGASPRVLPRLAYLANQGTVLFGGATAVGGAFLDDTLVWNGTSWTTLFSFVRPSPRYGHDMVTVGSGATSIWLFGGYGGSYLNDTWRLGGNGWQQVGTFGPTPPVRSSHRIAYDERRGRLVLFGGQGASANFLGDTWELTLGPSPTWTQVSPAQSPSPRWNHAMEYEPARGVVVLFGGYGPPSGGGAASFRNDVWEYNGVTWRQRSVSGAPPSAREAAGMSWHPTLQRFVVQGGYSPTLPYGPTDTFFYRAPIDVPGQGMVDNPVALRSRTLPVAGQFLTLEFPNPSSFGWMLVHTEPDTIGLPLFPDPIFCGAGRLYGAGGIIVDAMGDPGRVGFQIPAALAGTALTCQGIALTKALCFHFTDPLLLTIGMP